MVKKVSKSKPKAQPRQSQKQTVIVNLGSKRGSAPARMKMPTPTTRYIPSADKFIQPNTIIQQPQNLGELLKSLRSIDNPVPNTLSINISNKTAPSIEASKPVPIPNPKATVPALGGVSTPVPTLGNPFNNGLESGAPKTVTEALSQSSRGLSSFVKSKLETPFQFIASKLVAEEPKPEPPSLERTAPAVGGTTPTLQFVGKTGRSLEVASQTESAAGTPSSSALVPTPFTKPVPAITKLIPETETSDALGGEKTVLDLMTPDEPSSIVPDEAFYEFPYDDDEPVVVQGTAEPTISPILDEGGGSPTRGSAPRGFTPVSPFGSALESGVRLEGEEPSTADVLTPSVPLAPTALSLATGRAEEAPPQEASDLSGGGGTPRAKSSRGEDYTRDFNFVKEYLKDSGYGEDNVDLVQEILKSYASQGVKLNDYLKTEYPVVVSSPSTKPKKGRKPKASK